MTFFFFNLTNTNCHSETGLALLVPVKWSCNATPCKNIVYNAIIQCFSICEHQYLFYWHVWTCCFWNLTLACADIPIYIYHQLHAHSSLNHVKLSDIDHLFLDPSLMTPGWSANSAYHSTCPAMIKASADCKAHGKFHLKSLLCKS